MTFAKQHSSRNAHRPLATAIAAMTLLTACSSTPHAFVAEIQPEPTDQPAYDRAFSSCSDQVAAGDRESFQRERVETGAALGTGTAVAGGAAIAGGVAAGGWAGLASATAGAGLVVLAPVAAVGVTTTIRHRRERAITQAMEQCLAQEDYVVARWRRASQEEIIAGVPASPTRARTFGATGSTYGGFTRDAEGDLTGARSTELDVGEDAYAAETTFESGDGFSHDTSCSGSSCPN